MKHKYLSGLAVAILGLSLGAQVLMPVLVYADGSSDMTAANKNLDAALARARREGTTLVQDKDQVLDAGTEDEGQEKQAQAMSDEANSINAQNDAYQKKLDTYNQQLAAYKKKTSQTGTVDGSELLQHLSIGSDPKAKVSFTPAKGVNTTVHKTATSPDDLTAVGDSSDALEWCDPYNTKHWHGRSMQIAHFKGKKSNGGNIPGKVGTATWTNLTHSSYVDPATGQTHPITKIKMTFSNEHSFLPPLSPGWMTEYWKPHFNEETKKSTAGLVVYNDPTTGVWFTQSDSIDTNVTFYGSDDQPINFKPNSAYFGFGSLNHWNRYHKPAASSSSKEFYHVEEVQMLSGGHGENLSGSLVSNHPGDNEYADESTSDNVHVWSLFNLTSNSATFRWHMQHDKTDNNVSQLYTFGTAIPAFSGLVRPSLTLHYHQYKYHVLDQMQVSTNYVNSRTGLAVAPSNNKMCPQGSTYTTTAAVVPRYHLMSQSSNTSGTVGSSPIKVYYYYAPDPTYQAIEKVRVHYIAGKDSNKQENGQTLVPSETITGKFGSTYNTFSKQIMGWHLLTTPNNATGKLARNTPDVNYLYDRNNEVVTVHYVDTKGHKLANDQTYLGLYGLSYSTKPIDIDNYHLSKMPGNASGTYGNSPTDVTYVYDDNPAIKEGLSRDSATFTNYENIVNTSEAKLQYSNTYHYVTKATVGGSMTLDQLSLYSTLNPGVSPLIKGGDINNQNIKVYRVDDNQLTDITADGNLTYTTGDSADDTAVKTSSDPNTLYSVNRTRRVYWTAKDPQSLVGQKLVMDVPAVIRPDSDKLDGGYSSSSGIRVNDLAAINESNDISESDPVRDTTTSNKSLTSQQTVADMPNIYTVKAYKSMFNTGDKIKGTIYFKLYHDLVAEKHDDGKAALTVSLLGNSQKVDIPVANWSNSGDVFKVNVDTNTSADNHPSNFSWSSNKTSQSSGDVVLTKSLIKSESSTDGVEETDYRDDGDLYSASNTAVQNKPSQTTGTDGSGVEGVETYYRQDTDHPQYETNKEMTPLYVKLMEYMHANYQPMISAKSGYGIKNDVTLNYYGRHLNTNSETNFLKNNLATTFNTADDLTTAKGKSSSKIKNNQSELLGQTVNEMSDDQLRAGLASTNDTVAYLSTRFPSSQVPSLLKHQTKSPYMWDQAGDDVNTTHYFGHLSSSDQSFIDTADTATQSAPTDPILYQMAYQFNKRLLNNGVEYADPKDAQATNSQLQNATTPPANAHNGGHLFYTNQWLPLGNYDTTYQSHAFGSNDFIFKLPRKLNIYGHRYLAKGAGPDGDTYDDLAIQPVITGDLNKSNTTFASNNWTNK